MVINTPNINHLAHVRQVINRLKMDNISLLAKRLFFERTEDTRIQFFRYIFVGGVATIIDMGSLYVFTSMVGIHYLISAAIAFCFWSHGKLSNEHSLGF